jgi:hypothetical protein
MAAKDRTWAQTKTGGTAPLKLFYEWFEKIVFTKGKVDPNSFFGINAKPQKGATFAKAHGLYLSSKGPSKAPDFATIKKSIKVITDANNYKTYGYLDLAYTKKEHIVLSIDNIKDTIGTWVVFSIWDGLKEAPKTQKEKPWKVGGTPQLLYKFKLTETGISVRDPSKTAAKSKKGKDGKIGTVKLDTAQQELISTAIFKAVLEKRTSNWVSFEKMYNDPKSGLKAIHSGLNKVNRYDETDWWLHFDRQYKELITSAAKRSGLKVGHYEVYNRDGTGMKPGEDFMQFISDLITKGTGGSLDEDSIKMFAKKDSWNPADIWLLNTTDGAYEKVKKELEAATTVAKVNTIMQNAFHDKVIKGISLKKNRGGEGQLLWDEVNLFPTVKGQKGNMPQVVIKTIEFDPHYNKKLKGFSSVTSNVILTDNNKAGRSYKLTFRSNQSYMTDITYEFGEANMPAQLGKVPKDRFDKKLVDLKLPGISGYPKLSDTHTQTFNRIYWTKVHKAVTPFLKKYDWKINMSSRSDLKSKVSYKEFKSGMKNDKTFIQLSADKMKKKYKEALADKTEVNKTEAWENWIDNLEHSMGTRGTRREKVNTVMMQMVDFIYLLTVMQKTMNKSGSKQTFESFMTDLFYWAQKKGQQWHFGPFAKSY